MTIEWTGLKSFKNPAIIARLNQIAQNVGETLLDYSAKKVKKAYTDLGTKLPGHYYPDGDDITDSGKFQKNLKETVAKMAKYNAKDLLKSIKLIKESLIFYIPGDPLDKESYAWSARIYNMHVKNNEIPFAVIVELKTQWAKLIKSLFNDSVTAR